MYVAVQLLQVVYSNILLCCTKVLTCVHGPGIAVFTDGSVYFSWLKLMHRRNSLATWGEPEIGDYVSNFNQEINICCLT